MGLTEGQRIQVLLGLGIPLVSGVGGCVGVLGALTPRILMALVVGSFPCAALIMYPLPLVSLETEEGGND